MANAWTTFSFFFGESSFGGREGGGFSLAPSVQVEAGIHGDLVCTIAFSDCCHCVGSSVSFSLCNYYTEKNEIAPLCQEPNFFAAKDSIIPKNWRILLLCGGNASRLKQGQNLIKIYKVLVSGLDGWNCTICNQLAKGIFGDLGFGIKLLEVVSRLFDTSDFTHSITSGVMDIDHQSHMNALEEKLLQRTASDFEEAAPVVCPHINIRIPALRF